MSFNPVEELKNIVKEIEDKVPVEIENQLREKSEYLMENGIIVPMHVGNTQWTLKTASEWLLSQFVGIVEKAKEEKKIYAAFGTWLQHVYHFVIDNKVNLPEE